MFVDADAAVDSSFGISEGCAPAGGVTTTVTWRVTSRVTVMVLDWHAPDTIVMTMASTTILVFLSLMGMIFIT